MNKIDEQNEECKASKKFLPYTPPELILLSQHHDFIAGSANTNQLENSGGVFSTPS